MPSNPSVRRVPSTPEPPEPAFDLEQLDVRRLRPRRRRRKSHHGPSNIALAQLQRTIRTQPIMVPRVDWSDVRAGVKTEFRRYGAPQGGERFEERPVLLYTIHPATEQVDAFPAILVATWREPMGAITAESLRREGFADLGEFRRYIEQRYPNGGFRPLAMARTYRVRPWKPTDTAAMAEWALRSLFGDLVP